MKLVRSTESARPRVVIVGGGFAGLRVARGLRRSPVDVTLIDRSNHHLFQPLLYQVATAGLGGPDIAAPLRKVLERQANTRVWMAEVQRIDREARIVVTDRGPVEYDYLVVAAGATHSYFNNPDWAENAPGLKTLADALEIRRRVLRAFEAAETESNEQLRRALLTFVVVGAGPTGVELAGAIAEMARHTLPGQYRAFDPSQARVLLVEQSERVLPTYPTRLSEKAREQLERLGVEVKTSCRVSGLDDEKVMIRDQALACRTVLWAAGVQASPLARALSAPLDRFGRVQVQADLTIPGDSRVFAVGDIAAVALGGGQWVPGVAPAAIQQGKHAARSIQRLVAGKQPNAFRYRDKGSMATIGRSAAVVDAFRLRFSGMPAWLAWLFVHVMYLVGFRNRISVMFNWAWAYLTYQRGARIIIGEVEPQGAAAKRASTSAHARLRLGRRCRPRRRAAIAPLTPRTEDSSSRREVSFPGLLGKAS